MTADEVAGLLRLQPHPEGGFFRETFRDLPEGQGGGRGASTAIYYLLRDGEVSAWHRVRDAAEVWHHYAGAPIDLALSADGRSVESLRLGSDLAAGERPQAVAPGFEFAAFEMATAGWEPGG